MSYDLNTQPPDVTNALQYLDKIQNVTIQPYVTQDACTEPQCIERLTAYPYWDGEKFHRKMLCSRHDESEIAYWLTKNAEHGVVLAGRGRKRHAQLKAQIDNLGNTQWNKSMVYGSKWQSVRDITLYLRAIEHLMPYPKCELATYYTDSCEQTLSGLPCLESAQRVQVHHIMPAKVFLRYGKDSPPPDTIAKLHQDFNLMCLCRLCHERLEREEYVNYRLEHMATNSYNVDLTQQKHNLRIGFIKGKILQSAWYKFCTVNGSEEAKQRWIEWAEFEWNAH